MIKLYRSIAALLLSAILFVACGGTDLIRSFRVALAASGPLVNSLVSSGAIGQGDASSIIQDFNDGAQCADTLQLAFKATRPDDPEAKSKKLNASANGLRCFRVITQRRNFEKNARVKQAADIAEGILASLVVFYSEPGAMQARANATDNGRSVTAADEKDLEKKLKEQVKALERALKL